ncbi:hypothetical protein SISNIDRAFT_886 [Sistotremastrum niveocremeum HHB9708]|uniref:Uncharacterized protein n=1 Tax=Sistotremastrum niveocremeum HHB9708 TaxID=1314777 RepID=A0A165AC98_9AGAM|nr:hypothetical protein SISNIDRAFT_886 [Sistotremastrum niveocremeum HHB9708]
MLGQITRRSWGRLTTLVVVDERGQSSLVPTFLSLYISSPRPQAIPKPSIQPIMSPNALPNDDTISSPNDTHSHDPTALPASYDPQLSLPSPQAPLLHPVNPIYWNSLSSVSSLDLPPSVNAHLFQDRPEPRGRDRDENVTPNPTMRLAVLVRFKSVQDHQRSCHNRTALMQSVRELVHRILRNRSILRKDD